MLAGLLPATAGAAWLEASSTHFVVYANDSERDIRLFSQQLERFHAAMSVMTGIRPEAPSPSSRVTIFIVSGEREVRSLYGATRENVSAFYIPRAGGSVAIVPRITTGTTVLDFSMTALLHEYAHHYLMSISRFPAPRWYSEGSAEFFASASFEKDGSVGIGRPAHHRAGELFYGKDVPVSELLDPANAKRRPSNDDNYYGRSWLLVHYLTFGGERQGQLQRYLRLLVSGSSPGDAAREAFGDFDRLEKDLDAYLSQGQINYLKMPAARLETGPIAVRAMRAGEAAIMPVRIRSRRGVSTKQALALLPDAREIAMRFPDDPAVLSALAEAEHDAGNDREAIVAADAAIARDPTQVNAYVQKGYSLFRIAASDADPVGAFTRARQPFLELNRLENNHPLPLIYYYLSFLEQKTEPTPTAIAGLKRAADLAPFDLSLRMMLARQQVLQRQFAEARASLAPIAFNPHGGTMAGAAQRIIARIDSDPAWDGKDFDALAEPTDKESTSASSPAR